MRPKFQKFHRKSFLFESPIRTVLLCHLDGRTFAASNFHIEVSRVRTRRSVVWTVDLMHAISIFDTRMSGPWWLASGRLDLNCDTCLMDEGVRAGIHIVWMVATIFPYLYFGKKSWSFGRTLRVIQTGCWIVRTDASWSSSKLLNTEEGPDENPRRPNGWCFSLVCVRTIWHVVQTASALDSWASGRYDTTSGRLAGNRIFLLANCVESSGNTSE
jgi:hypothetical protein